MKHLLGAHLEDHIGVGAHPEAARRYLAEQRVKNGAVAPLVNRIDPDEHTIEPEELCAHGGEDIVLVDHRFRIDADIGERRDDNFETAGLQRCIVAGRFIAPPQDKPNAYLATTMTKIVNGHPNSRLDELLPWTYPAASALKDMA